MRKIAEAEKPLISWLLSASRRNESVESLTVSEIKDGGMGSMVFDSAHEDRRFGETISECQFVDRDGVAVIASLNTDQQGKLYELDMWRTDFKPLIAWPESSAITKTTPNPSFQRTASGSR
jgi:hypothetical protein